MTPEEIIAREQERQKVNAAPTPEDIIAREQARQTESARGSLYVTRDMAPDQAAKVVDLASRRDIDFGTAWRQRDKLTEADQQTSTDAVLARSPRLAAALSDPAFAAISRDSLNELARIESDLRDTNRQRAARHDKMGFFQSIASALYNTPGQVGSSAIKMGRSLAPQATLIGLDQVAAEHQAAMDVTEADALSVPGSQYLTPEQRQRLRENMQANREAARAKQEAHLEDVAPDVEREIGKLKSINRDYQAMAPQSDNWVLSGYYSGVDSGVQSLPGFVASFVTRNPAAGLAWAGANTYMQEYGEAKTEGARFDTAHEYASRNAMLEVGTELLPFHYVFGGAGKSLASKWLKAQASEIAGEQVATYTQDWNNWQYLHPEKTEEEFMSERMRAAVETLVATLVISGPMNAVALGTETYEKEYSTQAKAAKRFAESLKTLRASAESAPAFARSRQQVKDYIEQAADGDTVLLDDEGLNALFQSGPDAFRILMGQLGVEQDKYESAISEGNDIEVSVASLVALEDRAQFDQLVDIAKQEFDAKTPAQVRREAEDDLMAIDLADLQEALKDEDQALEGFERVQLHIERKLIEAGRSPAESKAGGVIWGAVFRQLAEAGLNEAQVFERLGLQIENTDQKGVRTPSMQEPQSLLSFVKARGGIREAFGQDERGYMRGEMQAITGTNLPGLINNKGGQTLDEMAMLAREAGYDIADDQAFIDAMQRELGGEKVYRTGEGEAWRQYQESKAKAQQGDAETLNQLDGQRIRLSDIAGDPIESAKRVKEAEIRKSGTPENSMLTYVFDDAAKTNVRFFRSGAGPVRVEFSASGLEQGKSTVPQIEEAFSDAVSAVRHHSRHVRPQRYEFAGEDLGQEKIYERILKNAKLGEYEVSRTQNGGFELVRKDTLARSDVAALYQRDVPGTLEWEAARAKGLDMSTEARMQRARDMGFDTDTVLYHGTAKGGFSEFDPYGTSSHGLFGQGVYLTDNPDVASSYTTKGMARMERRGETPRQAVYPVVIKLQNPIDMAAPADVSAWNKAVKEYGYSLKEFEDAGDIDLSGNVSNEEVFRALENAITDEQIPMYEGAERVQDILRAMGHDGVTHVGGGRVSADGVQHNVSIVFDPENIRSVNAAFDPDMADSPNLLYQSAKPITPDMLRQEAEQNNAELDKEAKTVRQMLQEAAACASGAAPAGVGQMVAGLSLAAGAGIPLGIVSTQMTPQAQDERERRMKEWNLQEHQRLMKENPEYRAAHEQYDARMQERYDNALAEYRAAREFEQKLEAYSDIDNMPADNQFDMNSWTEQVTGVSGEFLDDLIGHEADGDWQAQADTSSAKGGGQFIDSTWLRLMRQHGPELGLDAGLSKDDMLALRTDRRWGTMMTAYYAMENRAALEKKLDRPVTQKDAYLAHFLGSSAAAKALSMDPQANAAEAFPAEAGANQNVFYKYGNLENPRTVGEMIERQTKGFSAEPLMVWDYPEMIDAEPNDGRVGRDGK